MIIPRIEIISFRVSLRMLFFVLLFIWHNIKVTKFEPVIVMRGQRAPLANKSLERELTKQQRLVGSGGSIEIG